MPIDPSQPAVAADGAARQWNANLLRDCIRRKKTFRRTAFQSTPPHRSRASLTKSFVTPLLLMSEA